MATEVQRQPHAAMPESESEAPVAVRLSSLQLTEDERRGDHRPWGRRFVWLAVLLLVGGGTAAGLYYRGTSAADIPEFDAVAFGDSGPQDVVQHLTGYIEAHTKLTLAPRAAGMIIELPIEAGQVVKKGQLIAQIDPAGYRVDYEQAKAALKMAEIQLQELKNGPLKEEVESYRALVAQAAAAFEVLNKEWNRKLELEKRNPAVVTDAEFENLQSKLKEAEANLANQTHQLALIEHGPRPEKIAAAEAEVERNEALVARAKLALDNATLVSPIDGIVLEKKGQVGEDVHPEIGTVVIADFSREVEVNVQEDLIRTMKIGQPCDVIPDAFNDRVFKGELASISPVVNRAQGVVPVKVKVLEPDPTLLVNMNCNVIFKRHPDDARTPTAQTPTLPKGAVVTEAGKSFVYVVQNDVAHKRPIETGASTADDVEIKAGLNKGDVVLTSTAEVHEGMAVRARIQPQSAG